MLHAYKIKIKIDHGNNVVESTYMNDIDKLKIQSQWMTKKQKKTQ